MPNPLVSCLVLATMSASPQPEISFDIWDWTKPCQDLALFETWVEDLAEIGVNRVEISVPWRVIEPEPGVYDLTWLTDRVAVCERAGVGMRLRINSYYAGATPDWYTGDRWEDIDGKPAHQQPPSFMNELFWEHYGEMCKRIAVACRGKDVLHNAFIGIHAELKWADWWSYDASTLAAWRAAISADPRPAWLADVAGDAPLPERPAVPGQTAGVPDTDPVNRAWIAFREHCWRTAVDRFTRIIREADPGARISSPLGESYRRQSAHMSNLDYHGLSRGSDQIVHSYDFFWHTQDPAWVAGAVVESFRGITGLPVAFEFDGSDSMFKHAYTIPHLLSLGQSAARAGAGLKMANNSYQDTLPSQQPLLGELIRVWDEAWREPEAAPKADTVLLLLSKWAAYSWREDSEWLHTAQFGVFKLLDDAGIPVRIICEDNLGEDLSGYRALYLACSPRELMPASAREKLAALDIPVLEDWADIPASKGDGEHLATGLASLDLTAPGCPLAPQDLSGLGDTHALALDCDGDKHLAHRPGHGVFGFPVGALYLNGGQSYTVQGLVLWALQQVCEPQT